MNTIQTQMIFCCQEQWKRGYFEQVQLWGDCLRLDTKGACTGVYVMPSIDSGEQGFSWGRAVIEAELPEDTALRVYAYAADIRQWGDWEDIDKILPTFHQVSRQQREKLFGHPITQSTDFYIPRIGRYLWLLFELTTTGMQSPVIYRLRLWMDGGHMIDDMPAIYREDSFTKRFLSIFDSMYQDMERAIDTLPGQFDYEYATGQMLQYLASWVCIENTTDEQGLRTQIASALSNYETQYTPEGVKRSIFQLTGKQPILIEHFQVSPNLPDCQNPAVYRRLYGDNPYCFFVLLPEGTFVSQQECERFYQEMEQRIPAGMSMKLIQLKPCIQLDWHTYLGINSRIGGYVPVILDEQTAIHYDITIGGAYHELC